MQIFVLIDALGWEYAEAGRFLADVLPYRTPLRTVLGFSSGAIPSILTGLPPERHGQWNLVYYDPEHSPFRWLRHLGFLPDRVLDHRVSRKLLKEAGRHLLGMGKNFECHVPPRLLPWFNFTEKTNIYRRGGIPGAASIFDRLAEAGIPYRAYEYHQASDAELLRRARAEVESRAAQFFFVYLCELDAFLHLHCHEPELVAGRLRWYGAELRKLFESARQAEPDSTVAVFSDHGMTPVERRVDVAAGIERLGFRMPEDYLAAYDSTMARFWFFHGEARHEITGLLEGLGCGRVLSVPEQERLGIRFPDRRYGDIIFLMQPGWLIARSGFSGGWMPNGMHGYHPDDPHSDGVFLSGRRPEVPVREIRDVYRCMWEAAAPARV